MIPIPVPNTFKSVEALPKLKEYIANLLYRDGVLISRPACIVESGYTTATTTGEFRPSLPRGLFVFKNQMYSVFGQGLYSTGAVNHVVNGGNTEIYANWQVQPQTNNFNGTYQTRLAVINSLDIQVPITTFRNNAPIPQFEERKYVGFDTNIPKNSSCRIDFTVSEYPNGLVDASESFPNYLYIQVKSLGGNSVLYENLSKEGNYSYDFSLSDDVDFITIDFGSFYNALTLVGDGLEDNYSKIENIKLTIISDSEVQPQYVGEIKGSDCIDTAEGFTQLAIAAGTANYYLDGTQDPPTLNSIPVTDSHPASISVEHIDGRFIWTPTNGSELAYSSLDQSNVVGPLNFFDAETMPDGNKFSLRVRNDLFVAGEKSIEQFRSTGISTNPFVRVNNSIVSVGYIAAGVQTKDTFMFLGKDANGGFYFYLYDSGQAIPVSSSAIDEVLNNDYTINELQQAKAQRLNWRGIDCYVFSLKYHTFVYHNGSWSVWDSGTRDEHKIDVWPFYHATYYKSAWYVQATDGIYKLTSDRKDSSGAFACRFLTFARMKDESSGSVAGLEVSVSQTPDKGTVGLSVSRDGALWSDLFYRDVGGDYDKKLIYRPLGGLGQYDSYIGMMVYTTSNIEFAADNMVIL